MSINNNNKELRVLRYVMNTVDEIEKAHNHKRIFFEQELTSVGYGWHNTRFPPEYREYILKKTTNHPICKEYDLYYLFMNACEIVYGSALPFSFFLRGEIKQQEIKDCMTDWDDHTAKALLNLIRKCTRIIPSKRIMRIEDLKETPEWLQIQQRYKEYTGLDI